MILPTKHISLHNSYLGAARTVLESFDSPLTTKALWGRVSSCENVASANRFFRILDFLYAIGALEFRNGKIRKVENAS